MRESTIPPNEEKNTRMSPLGYPSNLLAPGSDLRDGQRNHRLDRPANRQPATWWIGFVIAFGLLMMFFFALAWLFIRGVGIWGINIPVAWGFAIVNFVWWVGIGHAGTFISAILLLMFQHWRTAINRFAEAMTLFAVACAGLMPLLHLGRPWLFFYLFPYPDTMGLWPQFRSPLVWDVFAVGTYFIVSLLFWYLGLVPDLATIRDRARKVWQKKDLRRSCAGLAQFRRTLAAPPDRLPAARGARDPARVYRFIASSVSISRLRSCRAGIRQSFRLTSSPARSTLGSPWS